MHERWDWLGKQVRGWCTLVVLPSAVFVEAGGIVA